ncbi:MAG: glycosyltransferase family 4 protein [Pseudonocardia sp.]
MRVAVVHSFYRSGVPSGENVVVDAQIRALEGAGHDVLLVAQHSDERLRRRTYPLEAAATTVTGLGPDPVGALVAFRPDVVHVHNLFPNFGTRWLPDWPGRLVATLHNFRPMCAAGTLCRDGEICTRCGDGDPWAAVRYRCYRGSRVATLPLAWRNRGGVSRDAVVRRADALVVISDRARDVYTAAGVPADRLHVVPNFVDPPPDPVGRPDSQDRWLFVGRLSAEKGLAELLKVWPRGEYLDVIGDGPDRAGLMATAPAGVRFLGQLPHDEVRTRMPGHLGLVFPSVWFEAGPPQVYIEALAAGLPTLAIDGNGTSDDIVRHGLGIVVGRKPTIGHIAAALDALRTARPELSPRCRESYGSRFRSDGWLATIERVYAGVPEIATGTAPER